MRSIAKEKIMNQLMQLPGLSNQYTHLDPGYVQNVQVWLQDTEKQLEPLRLPAVSKLATLRGTLVAADDGYTDPCISEQSRSKRKAKRALAAHTLTQAEEILSQEVAVIEQSFSELIDKLSQLLAIRFAQDALPVSPGITTQYIDQIWTMLGEIDDTKSMYRYIQARTGLTDRRYLLHALLENMLSHT